MKKYTYTLLAFLILSGMAFAQTPQQYKNWWYMGWGAGAQFTSGSPVAVTNGMTNVEEGTAVMSDKTTGALLFYTEGMTIWNNTHVPMTNGTGLMGNPSSTQSALIIPRPGSTSQYFVFTIMPGAGLRYNVVDMTLSGGLGAVTATKNVLLGGTNVDEKLTGTQHANGIDYWVTVHVSGSNQFISYPVTAAGPGAGVPSNVGPILNGQIGYMNINPCGTKIGLSNYNPAMGVADFNNATGVVSNWIDLNFGSNYSSGFSPDGTKFYHWTYTPTNAIFEVDLNMGTQAAINASRVQIATAPNWFGAFVNGKDGKMYIPSYAQSNMHVINNPNGMGAAVGYVANAIPLSGKIIRLAEPNFVEIRDTLKLTVVASTVACGQATGSATVFATGGIKPYSYTWTPSAQTGSVATGLSAGIYTVTVKDASCWIKTATVQINSSVGGTLSIVSSTNVSCFGGTNGAASATVNGGSGTFSYTWMPSGQTTTLATGLSAGVYTVTASGGGCTTTTVVTITQPTQMTGTVNPFNALCNAAATGSATVNGSGGTGAYTYSWTNSQTTQTATGLSAGNYSVTITDANGCKLTLPAIIGQPTPLVVTPSASSPSACVGNSVTLSAVVSGGTSAYTYTWTGGPSNGNYTVTQATAGVVVYTVTGTDANSCVKANTISVTFVANPTPSVANATICFGKTASLTATGATNFTWMPSGATGSTFNTSPAVGVTVYTVTGAIGSCTAITTVSVTVNALPVPTATNTGPYCAGAPIQLNGSGATTYTWTGPSAFTSNLQNPSILSSSVTNAGLYTFSVTDVNGCQGSATTSVVVNALPAIVVNNPTVCLNQTILLTATGGTAYSWAGPLAFTSNLQNPTILNAALNMSGLYTVTATSPQGCTNTAVANVTVYPLPNPGITSNNPVCVGNNLNLNGSGGATYSWTGPNGFTSNLQNPVISGVTLPATGVYTLVVSAGSCTATTTASVLVNPLPVIAFTNSNVLCNGGNTGVSTTSVSVGTGPFTYLWTNGQTTSTGTGLTAGTYSVTVTDANGCISTAVTTIAQPTPLTLNINSSAPSACANTPINLSGVVGGGTGPNYTYTWNPGPNTNAYNVTEPMAGNYNYVLSVTDQNGCVITKNINLTFFPQPTVTATSATICAGEKTGLTASGATSYTWMPVNVVSNTFTYSGTSSMNLTVIGESNGCKNNALASIVVNALPDAVVVSNSKTGCVPACLSFTCNSSSAIQTIGWNFEDGGTSITNSVVAEHCYGIAGDYNITAEITDLNGCKATATFSIGVYPIPTADFNYAPYKPIVNNADVTFTDASYGANIVKWDWFFKNQPKPHSNEQNPTYIYDEEGTYAVALIVTSDHGCTDTIVQTIVVGPDYGIYVPNIFTPNGDGLNDTFQPKGFGITKYELRIFNRWGEQLMFTNDFAQGWDGMYKGKLSQDDTYIWKINLTNVFGKSHELAGNVTLIK